MIDKYNFNSFDYKRNLLLLGKTGVGKTYIATKLLKKYYDSIEDTNKSNIKNFYIYSISDGMFKQMIKSNILFLRHPKDWEVSLNSYPLHILKETKLLLYDDLGVSDTTEAYIRDLTFIIDERIKNELITIYTSNLNEAELNLKLNDRIVSRLLYNTDIITIEGEDKRCATTRYYKYFN